MLAGSAGFFVSVGVLALTGGCCVIGMLSVGFVTFLICWGRVGRLNA